FQSAHGNEIGLVSPKKSSDMVRQRCFARRQRDGMRVNHANPVLGHAEPIEELFQLPIYTDDPVKLPEDESREGEGAGLLPGLRLWITSRMKREHSLASRHRAAGQTEHQHTMSEIAPDVQVNDVVL